MKLIHLIVIYYYPERVVSLITKIEDRKCGATLLVFGSDTIIKASINNSDLIDGADEENNIMEVLL